MVKVPDNRDPKRIWGKGTKDNVPLAPLYALPNKYKLQIPVLCKNYNSPTIYLLKIDTGCFLHYTMFKN